MGSTRMHVLVTGLLVFFLLLTVNCYHTTDGGWTSLLEQNSGHGHFSDQHFKDFSWRPEPEPVDVNGNLLNFDHSESDFTSYFNEDYTSNRRNEDYASSRKNSSRKNDAVEEKQFGLGFGVDPILNSLYYVPNHLNSHYHPGYVTTNKPTTLVTRGTRPSLQFSTQAAPVKPRPSRTTGRPRPTRTTRRPRSTRRPTTTSRSTRKPNSFDIFDDYDFSDNFNGENDSKFDFNEDEEDTNFLMDVDQQLSPITPADVEGRVRSLQEIFDALHVKSPGCQRMLVCHLAKDQEQFTPMSHLVLDLLEIDTARLERGGLRVNDTVRYLDLLQAVEYGRHRMCYKYSDVCQFKGEDMINADGLRAWKLMYKVLTMKALAVKEKEF